MIHGNRHPLAAGPVRRGDGREQVAGTIRETGHVAQVNTHGCDEGRGPGPPQRAPERPVQAQEQGGVLRGGATHGA